MNLTLRSETQTLQLRSNYGTPDTQGAAGKSAYQSWLDLGNVGTEQDFIDSLQGASGSAPTGGTTGQVLGKLSDDDGDVGWIDQTGGSGGGADGASAYEIWLDLGNVGTEQDFIDSLQGAPGATGAQGIQGIQGPAGAQGPAGPSNVITESGGPTSLTVGAIPDAQLLVRVGANVVGLSQAAFATAAHGHSLGSLGAAAAVHTHAFGDLSGVAAASHSHGIGDLTGVAAASHTHAAADITSGVLAPARVTSATEGQYVRMVGGVLVGDTPAGGGGSGDITDVVAGTGLSGGAASGSATLNVVYGSTAGTAAEGNDARLSDARTPTAHASSHATGQPDAISPASIGAAATSHTHAAAAVTSGTFDLARMTAGTANQRLRVNAAGNAIEGGIYAFVSTADTVLPGAATPTDLAFPAFSIVNGGTYFYTIKLFYVAGGTGSFAGCCFNAAGGASVSAHHRAITRGGGASGSNMSSGSVYISADLTSFASAGGSAVSTTYYVEMVGRFVCNGSGTIVPQALTGGSGGLITVLSRAIWEIERVA